MTIKEKLEAMKAIEDKKRAIDQAFVLGQQNVQFTVTELRAIEAALSEKIYQLNDNEWGSAFSHQLVLAYTKTVKLISDLDTRG